MPYGKEFYIADPDNNIIAFLEAQKTKMKNSDVTISLFREAVEAIDTGNKEKLNELLNEHAELAHQRLDIPSKGYFAHP